MNKIYLILGFSLLLAILPNTLFSQKVNLTIRVLQVGNAGFSSDGARGNGVFNFYINHKNNNLNTNRDQPCITTSGTNEDREVNITFSPFALNLDPQEPRFNLIFSTHNERKGGSDPCTPRDKRRNKDIHIVDDTILFRIDEERFNPGVFSEPILLENFSKDTRAYAIIQLRYSIPPPDLAAREPSQGLVCSDRIFALKTNVPLNRKNGLQYVWEYFVEGDTIQIPNSIYESCIENCEEIEKSEENISPQIPFDTCVARCGDPIIILKNWRKFKVSLEDRISFKLIDILDTLFRQNQRIKFRVKAISMETASPYREFDFVDFSPIPPTFSSIQSSPSCQAIPNGSIEIKGIEGFAHNDTYLYILQDKLGQTESGCNPIADSTGCGGVIANGLINSSTILIENVPVGEYSLWLANSGASFGTCFSSTDITVAAHPNLEVSLITKEISCQGAQDGQITLEIQEGFGEITSRLIHVESNQKMDSHQGVYTNLGPGLYRIEVKDGCNQSIREFIEIVEPRQVKAEFVLESVTCLNPGNGLLSVLAKEGSGLYNYELTLDNQLLVKLDSASATSFVVNDLSPGNYTLKVRDTKKPFCEGIDTSFLIQAPKPLGIAQINTQDVSCFLGQNGQIKVQAQGGIGLYIYTLIHDKDSLRFQNESGVFEGLPAGNYYLEVMTSLQACNDFIRYPNPIVIHQPDPVLISHTKQNIPCPGANQGVIEITINGGNAPYRYKWEKFIDNQWNSLALSSPKVENIPGGIYRVIVQDNTNCSYTSEEIEILEPDFLEITKTNVLRESCEAIFATLELQAQGGTPPYTFLYTPRDTTLYKELTQDTPLASGSYQLRVMDQQGCISDYPQLLEILPNSISVKAEVHPVCFQKRDGKILVEANGGSAPYVYGLAINQGNQFQTSPNFTNLAAGVYSIIVRDSRGCTGALTVEVPKRPEEPEPRFLVATKENTLDTLVVKEVSVPKPDSIIWHFDPATIILVEDANAPQIQFEEPGIYSLGMTAFFGSCSYRVDKTLNIQPFDSVPAIKNPEAFEVIQKIGIFPNPNNGEFEVRIEMARPQILALLIMNLKGDEVYRQHWDEVARLEKRIVLKSLANGTYILQAITDNDAREIRLIVNQ